MKEMNFNKTHAIIALCILGLGLLFVPGMIKLLVLVVIAIGIVVYFGKDKTVEVLGEFFSTVFNTGKEKLDEVAPKTTEKELKIVDVAVKEEDGKYHISLFTEIGEIKLAPRIYDTVPSVLHKGKTVTLVEENVLEKCRLIKKRTITAKSEDGDRVYNVVE